VVAALLMVSFVGISTTTGTGWPLVLVSLLAGALVTGLVLPPMWLVRTQVGVELPADAMVGKVARLRVDIAHGSGVAINVTQLSTGWLQARSGQVNVVPSTRGVVESLVVDLWTTAPLGLWSWRRRDTIVLGVPLYVAPPVVPVDVVELRQLQGIGDDLPRGVRPYAPGDDRRRVHWTATAREGELMVRELETTAGRRVVLLGGLGIDGRVEERAAWLHGVGLAALDLGLEIELVTLERSGIVAAPVRSPRELGRRLARAVPGGLPYERSAGSPDDVIDVADHVRRDARPGAR
jgi:uncharacterized protein (DUF58 family)